MLKDNHVYNFAQKNARYRYSYYGATTDNNIKDNEVDDYIDQRSLHLRKDYIDGFHVNTTYTSYAHFWLIRDILNVDKINYVSDEDNSIITALMRVFSDEIKSGTTNVFTYRIDKSLKKKEACLCYKEAAERLHDWKDLNGLKCSMREAAISKLASDLETYKLYGIRTVDDKSHPNFCDIFKYKKEYVTPAILLGLANRPFTFEDIIYLK